MTTRRDLLRGAALAVPAATLAGPALAGEDIAELRRKAETLDFMRAFFQLPEDMQLEVARLLREWRDGRPWPEVEAELWLLPAR